MKRNRNRALVLICFAVAVLLTSAVLLSGWPLAVGAVLFTLLVLRTAWKARWKSSDVGGLVGYGVHSHLQQIPIFWGQIQFWANRRRGLRAGLVEYKQTR